MTTPPTTTTTTSVGTGCALSVTRGDLKYALRTVDPSRIDPAHRKAVADAVSATLAVVPFLADFILAAPVVAVDRTGLPQWFVAATDGLRTYVEPNAFATMPLSQRVFVLAHEIMHNVGRHCHLAHAAKKHNRIAYKNTFLPYDHTTLNVALDMWINTVLHRSNIGQMPEMGVQPMDASIDVTIVTPIDIYAKLLDGAKANPNQTFDGLVDQPAGTSDNTQATRDARGVNLGGKPAGTSDHELAADEASEARHKERLAGAAARARASGSRASEMFRRLFDDGLKPSVRWQDILRAELARGGEFQRADWRVLDPPGIVRPYVRTLPPAQRRRLVVPAKTTDGFAPVLVSVDTSGSIGDTTLSRFLAEIIGIVNDCAPKALYIAWCDAAVHRVDTVDDVNAEGVRVAARKGAVGGGGTSFVPPFLWLAGRARSRCGATVPDDPPATMVYLTDGLGQFPTAEQITAAGISQLIWAVVGDAPVSAPGMVVRLQDGH